MNRYQDLLTNNNKFTIQFIQSVNTDNEPIYVYFMTGQSNWQKLQEKMKKEIVNLSSEGCILAYGKGHTPDKYIQYAIDQLIKPLVDKAHTGLTLIPSLNRPDG